MERKPADCQLTYQDLPAPKATVEDNYGQLKKGPSIIQWKHHISSGSLHQKFEGHLGQLRQWGLTVLVTLADLGLRLGIRQVGSETHRHEPRWGHAGLCHPLATQLRFSEHVFGQCHRCQLGARLPTDMLQWHLLVLGTCLI